MSNKTISITEGRKDLFKIAEEVQKPSTRYTLTVEGRPQAVILSADEFDSIMETMEIMSDPQVMKDIKESQEEIARGEYVTLDQLKKELGYVDSNAMVMRDAPRKHYSASRRSKKTTKK